MFAQAINQLDTILGYIEHVDVVSTDKIDTPPLSCRNSVEFADEDGDNITLILEPKLQQVQEYVNGKLSVHNVRYFHVNPTTLEFKDVGGFGMLRDAKQIETLQSFFSSLSVQVDFKVDRTIKAGGSQCASDNGDVNIKIDTMPGPGKKVLLLHGYCQNNATFQSRNKKKLFKYMKKYDLTFLEGVRKAKFQYARPDQMTYHDLNPELLKITMDTERRKEILNPENAEAEWLNLPEVLKACTDVWKSHGPFDAVFAFSQSTQIASMLCYLAQKGGPFSSLKCAIFCSGMLQPLPSNHDFGKIKRSNALNLPSFHAWSTNDKYVHKDESESLANIFVKSQRVIVDHKAHALPGKAKERKQIIAFLEKHLG